MKTPTHTRAHARAPPQAIVDKHRDVIGVIQVINKQPPTDADRPVDRDRGTSEYSGFSGTSNSDQGTPVMPRRRSKARAGGGSRERALPVPTAAANNGPGSPVRGGPASSVTPGNSFSNSGSGSGGGGGGGGGGSGYGSGNACSGAYSEPFTSSDEKLLKSMTTHLSLALSNALLFEQKIEESTALFNIAQARHPP